MTNPNTKTVEAELKTATTKEGEVGTGVRNDVDALLANPASDQSRAMALINEKKGFKLATGFSKFQDLDHSAIADALIDTGQFQVFKMLFRKLEGLNHSHIAERLIAMGQSDKLISLLKSGVLKGLDSSVAFRLMEEGDLLPDMTFLSCFKWTHNGELELVFYMCKRKGYVLDSLGLQLGIIKHHDPAEAYLVERRRSWIKSDDYKAWLETEQGKKLTAIKSELGITDNL